MSNLKFKVARAGTKQKIQLVGRIDETISSTLEDLMSRLEDAAVSFDLGGVESISSSGLEPWQDFLADVAARTSFEFENCTPFFIDFADVLPSILGRGRVVSFQVPLRCPECKAEETVLASSTDINVVAKLCAKTCDACGKKTAPDVDLETYLQFGTP